MLSVTQTTKGNLQLSGLPFVLIKDAILGKKYDLSLVFAGDTLARRLNKERRGKSYVPNILSFELDKNNGEIFINPTTSKKEAPKYGYTFKEYLVFLFIHGCCHLRGMEHSETMDKLEIKFRKKFNLKEPNEKIQNLK